jgi:polypeptide N-acetylgalactosaminyltransferase
MQELPVVLGERVSRIADAFGILLSRRCELFAVARHVVERRKLQIRNVETKNCLDTMGRKSGENLGMTYCHNLGGNQVFAYTKRQQIMSDDNCLDASNKNGPIKLVRCHGMGGNQAWAYDQVDKTVKHVNTGSCLQRPDPGDMNLPLLRPCNYSPGQQWIMESDFKWQARNHQDER